MLIEWKSPYTGRRYLIDVAAQQERASLRDALYAWRTALFARHMLDHSARADVVQRHSQAITAMRAPGERQLA